MMMLRISRSKMTQATLTRVPAGAPSPVKMRISPRTAATSRAAIAVSWGRIRDHGGPPFCRSSA
jgi:hypothetical protein